MAFELPQDIVATLTPEVKDLVMKPEVLAVIETVNKGLLAKRDELLTNLSRTKGELDAFGGIEGVKSAMTELTTLKAKPASSDATETYKQQLEAANLQLTQLKERQTTAFVDNQLTTAVKDAKGDTELLMPFIKNRVKPVVGADGNVTIQVLNASGLPMLTSTGAEATLKDLVGEFRGSEKYARLFAADNIGGAGTRNAGVNVGADNPFLKNSPSYNVSKQSELYRTNRELAITLAAAAGIVLK